MDHALDTAATGPKWLSDGFTAAEANKILGRTGEPFWQDESYDHWVRNRYELQTIIRYVGRNPVSAGLDANQAWPALNEAET